MPDAIAVSIAKAVHQHLADSAATLSQRFTLRRTYGDWDYNLKDDQRLLLDVMIATQEQKAEPATRTAINYIVPVNVCIRKKVGSDRQDDDTGEIDPTEFDPFMLLAEEVHELFTLSRLPDFMPGIWEGTKILASPITKHLADWGQFTAIIQVTFRNTKQII